MRKAWTDQEADLLRATYLRAGSGPVGLDDLARQLGRTKPYLSRQARMLGLTSRNRGHTEATKRTQAVKHAVWHKTHEHPRGFLGKTHTPEVRQKIGALSAADWEKAKRTGTGNMAPEHRQRRSDQMTARHEVDPTVQTAFTRTKGGVREDIGPMYFRSSWEANYARYLNWLVAQGEIKSWRYEAVTFWFEKIKRGVRSWKPDFEITNPDGSLEYHEVKGWDYPRGKTARKRMAIYHPAIKVVLIGEDEYKAVAKWKRMFPGWE